MVTPGSGCDHETFKYLQGCTNVPFFTYNMSFFGTIEISGLKYFKAVSGIKAAPGIAYAILMLRCSAQSTEVER